MKALSTMGRVALLTLLATAPAHALVIYETDGAVQAGDPSQLGRLSRGGIPQDWAGGELFPGVINPTTTYQYHFYVVNVGNTPFIQIDFDSISGNTFVSAYDTSYLPNSSGAPNLGFDTHWLGDAGFSGNFFGVDPLFFQVVVPENHNLVVVINTTSSVAGVGVGDPFHLIVEGFIDTDFTDPAPVPEPAAAVGLAGGGLALLVLRRRLRRVRAEGHRSAP